MHHTSAKLLCLSAVIFSQSLSAATSATEFFDKNITAVSEIKPNLDIQERFSRIANLMNPEVQEVSVAKIDAELRSLDESCRQQPSYILIRQLVYYSFKLKKDPPKSIYNYGIPPLVIRHLEIDRDPVGVLQAIAPFANSNDALSKSVISEFLSLVESRDYGHTNATSAYETFLKACFQERLTPDSILIEMFARQPGKSLLACERAYIRQPKERESIVLACRVVDNFIWEKSFSQTYGKELKVDASVTKALSELSRDKEWWPKLYVASMMRLYPEVRDPEIVKMLQQDANPLVQKVAKLVE